MSLPPLLNAGLVLILVSIGVFLAYIGYRRLRARRALRQAQYNNWHRQNATDIELLPIKMNSFSKQAATRSNWPRDMRDHEQIFEKIFTPTRTFITSKWGRAEGKRLLQCPVPAHTSTRRGVGDSDLPVPTRKKMTVDSEETSGFLCHAGSRDNSDPPREIWRKIEARETIEDSQTATDPKKSEPKHLYSGVKNTDEHTHRSLKIWPLSNTATSPILSDTEEGFRVDKVAEQYALVAERLHLDRKPQEWKTPEQIYYFV